MSDSTPILPAEQVKTTLATLAKKANQSHAACERAIRSALEHARRCGDNLIAAKGLVKHGEFQEWIGKNCKFSPQMARRYMTLANAWERILELAKRNHGFVLDSISMREALRLLSAGGAETEPEYLTTTCPSCGSRLVVTSVYWATCPNCFACRLYGIGQQATQGNRWTPRSQTSLEIVRSKLQKLVKLCREWPADGRQTFARWLGEIARYIQEPKQRQTELSLPATEEVQL